MTDSGLELPFVQRHKKLIVIVMALAIVIIGLRLLAIVGFPIEKTGTVTVVENDDKSLRMTVHIYDGSTLETCALNGENCHQVETTEVPCIKDALLGYNPFGQCEIDLANLHLKTPHS